MERRRGEHTSVLYTTAFAVQNVLDIAFGYWEEVAAIGAKY